VYLSVAACPFITHAVAKPLHFEQHPFLITNIAWVRAWSGMFAVQALSCVRAWSGMFAVQALPCPSLVRDVRRPSFVIMSDFRTPSGVFRAVVYMDRVQTVGEI
jgi:hypothetical protein